MQISKFARKPFFVEAVQVTEENVTEVSEWCEGDLNERNNKTFIKVEVHLPLHERQTEARIGDWVLKTNTGFKVYTNSAFNRSFIPVPIQDEIDEKQDMLPMPPAEEALDQN